MNKNHKRNLFFLLLVIALVACNTPLSTSTEPAMATPTWTSLPLAPTATSTQTIPSTQAVPIDPRGIYVYSEHLAKYEQELAQALDVPGVDGLTLLLGWDSLEPNMDIYDWTVLDQWMNAAVSSGKNVILAIRAGQDTPCWLFQSPQCGNGYAKVYAGATPLVFLVSPREGIGQSNCNTITIAAPWDPIFLKEWDSLLAHIATHLQSAGTYNTLISLRLSGINRTTAELRLPAEVLDTPCVMNSIQTWLTDTPPYRPARLLKAWDDLTSSYLRNFPDKYFGVEIIPVASGPSALEYPFPAIDNKGCTYQPPWPTDTKDPNFITGTCLNTAIVSDQNKPLLDLASQKFAGRLSVSYQNLDIRTTADAYPVYASQTWGTTIGYQVNDYDSFQRSACSGGFEHPGSCDSATYLKLLEVGIYPVGRNNNLRALYIEVLPPDAISFPDAIQQAHNELFVQP